MARAWPCNNPDRTAGAHLAFLVGRLVRGTAKVKEESARKRLTPSAMYAGRSWVSDAGYIGNGRSYGMFSKSLRYVGLTCGNGKYGVVALIFALRPEIAGEIPFGTHTHTAYSLSNRDLG